MKQILKDRFEKYIEKIPPSDCWIWIGGLSHGRGAFNVSKGLPKPAHRVSWELYRGPIPEGKFVCHTCDNKLCVNPDHLYIGTQWSNMTDAVARDRFYQGGDTKFSHCLKGHELNTDNTYIYSDGKLECKICRRVRDNIRKKIRRLLY